MNKEEFNEKINEAKTKYNKEYRELCKEYALSNNPYKIGQVVSDNKNTIEIKEIKVIHSFMSGYPSCFYTGPLLEKDGKPYKNGAWETIYQTNINKREEK